MFVDVKKFIKAKLPELQINVVPIEDCSFSFKEVEVSTDVPCSASIDLTADTLFTSNLKSICKKLDVVDLVENTERKKEYVPASPETYVRGKRLITFKLYENGIEGIAYFKDVVNGTNLIRFETKYKSNMIRSKTDNLLLVAGRKSFNSASDIKDIFTNVIKKHTESDLLKHSRKLRDKLYEVSKLKTVLFEAYPRSGDYYFPVALLEASNEKK